MCEPEDKEKAAIQFLADDFNQSYEQLRYYDEKILSVCKFMTTIYTAVFALLIGCYKLEVEKGLELSWVCIAVLVPALVFSVLFLLQLLIYRVYTVLYARYLNEQRNFFLSVKPLGFENVTNRNMDYKQPGYFNKTSPQILFVYAACLFNGILVSLLFSFVANKIDLLAVGMGILCFIVQIVCCAAYLTGKEKKG